MKLLRKSVDLFKSPIGLLAGLSTCSSVFSAKLDLKETFYPPVARTSLTSPLDHTKDHVGMWYTIDPARVSPLFGSIGLSRRYNNLSELFGETSLMIREPAVTIMDYIKKSNLNLQPNKFIMYGERGVGKTLALAHILHFLADDEWILVHLVQPNYWIVQNRVEITQSTTNEGYFDHTIVGSAWLQVFKSQNGPLLEKLGLVTKEEFVWTQRETSPAGTSLLEMVESGIQRPRYASEFISFLIRHLKDYATENRCKVAMVTEGINCFYTPLSRHKRVASHNFIAVEKLTMFNAFKELLNNDWKNGVVVATTDHRCSPMDRRDSHLPRYLLRKQGWDALEPLIPLKINDYTDLELNSVLSYYNDRNFLLRDVSHSEEAKEEMIYASQKNPLTLLKLVKTI